MDGNLSGVGSAGFSQVTPLQTVHGYQVAAGSATFRITFRVDADPGAAPVRCPTDKVLSCREATLPNRFRAFGMHVPTSGGQAVVPEPELATTITGHRVSMFLFADEKTGTAAPITDQQLLAIAAKPGFTSLVQEWASHPDWTNWDTSPTAPAASPTPTR